VLPRRGALVFIGEPWLPSDPSTPHRVSRQIQHHPRKLTLLHQPLSLAPNQLIQDYRYNMSAVALLNAQSAMTTAAQCYTRCILSEFAAECGISADVLNAFLTKNGLSGLPAITDNTNTNTNTNTKSKRKSKAKTTANDASAAAAAAAADGSVSDTESVSSNKSKRGGWDKMTPEQKAERMAKMKAGRDAKKAAKAEAVASAVAAPTA